MEITFKQALIEARTALVVQAPFFANLLFDRMNIREAPGLPFPGATDGKNIWLNPEDFAGYSVRERVFLLAHEVCHGMFMHMDRAATMRAAGGPDGKTFNPMKWNVANDLIINDLLIECGIGTFIQVALHDTNIATKADLSEEVYKRLPDDPQQGGGQGEGEGEGEGKGQGQGQGQGQDDMGENTGGGGFDSHIIPKEGGGGAAEEYQWKQAVAQARNAAKAMGQMPGALQSVIDEFLAPQVDWKEHLRMAIIKKAGRDTRTWSKPNRRKIALSPHIWMPGYTGFGAGDIVLAVDTSGSVSDDELRQFFGEMSSILSDLTPKSTTLMFCDAQVNMVEEIDTVSELQHIAFEGVKGRGGTAFKPVFDKVEELGLEPDCLVYLSDLECNFPDEPDYDVIWCSSTDIDAPWGTTVHVKF